MRPTAPGLTALLLLGCNTAAPTTATAPDAAAPSADMPLAVDTQLIADTPVATDVPVAVDAPVAPDPCRGVAEPAWTADPGLCLVRFAQNIPRVRGLAVAPNGDLLVVAAGSVVVLFDADGDGVSGDGERATFATAPGLNHGVAFDRAGRYLYASSDTTVYRWAYAAGARVAGDRATVVTDMPGAGNHPARPLAFDDAGALYVGVGSSNNVDATAALNATRAMVRRFSVATVPVAYAAGEVFASGLRNESGIAFDRAGRLWGVENGRDDLMEPRFGGDIHDDNPGEELNVLNGAGPSFFGYPSCWSEGALAGGGGAGTQHADTSIPAALRRDEARCQDATAVRPPAFVMPAHWAPLGVVEYTGSAMPDGWRGSLFVTSHGSWDRTMAAGRLIARAQLGADGRVTSVEPVVGQRDAAGGLRQGAWSVRPVDIRQGPDGALYFTDDLGGRVFRVGYRRAATP